MKHLVVLGVLCLMLTSTRAEARGGGGWSWNLGNNNPPGTTIGLNFLYLGDNFGFEVGIGSIDAGSDDSNDTDSANISGAVSIKYLFDGNFFRPYLQAGTGAAIGASSNDDDTSANAAIGGDGYYGAGVFLMGNPFYFYASFNKAGEDTFTQWGLGFDF